MRAVKLPSGSWRCRYTVDGKRKSVTVKDPTPQGRKKCEALAAQLSIEEARDGVLLSEAIERYISSREAVISPTTLTSYRSLQRTAYKGIEGKDLTTITEEVLQKWVNAFSRNHTPKTVRNAVALISASMEMFDERVPRITLPENRPPELYTPTDADIQLLLKEAEGTDLEKAIILAAFGTLRRGEICGLRKEDIKGNRVTVRRSLVHGTDGLVEKSPKTPQSVRTVILPEKAVAKLTPHEDGRIVALKPIGITRAFCKALDNVGLPHFRFHDLRAYAASIRHSLGIPDVYIMADGGWKTDGVLKRIYRREMDDKRKEFSAVASKHFEGILGSLDTKMDTKF